MRKLAFAFALLILVIFVNTALGLPGSGTEEEPWRIESLSDFNEFAADPNYWDDWTRLETDVNLAGQTYSTAVIAPDTNSTGGYQGTAFTGVFDGNGYKITGLMVDGAGNDYLGLFGFIDGGEVKNLGLEECDVSGYRRVGGLVGWNNGGVSNCHSTGDVSGYRWVGGLVGYNSDSVSNCYSSGSVSGDWRVGGLVGWNEYGSVSNCYSSGDVSGTYWDVGGLVGWNNRGSVSNCHSTGDVSGDLYVGGLVGFNPGGSVSNCYSTGDVRGRKNVGGLVGFNSGSVSNCYSIGDVSGDLYVGGLVGRNKESISNCHSTGNVSGDDRVGGLVGESSNSIVSNCHSTGSVSADDYVGGLVGYNYDGTISRCYSTGDVSGDDAVGGLVGYSAIKVSNCYSTGDVSGDEYVGGLVGRIEGCAVLKCYSTGDVDGARYVGGLVGENYGSRVSNCFWDTQTSGMHYSDGGTGKTTAEMQIESTFTDASWDFGTPIWLICEGLDYPRLWWEFGPPVLEAEPQETIGTSNLISWSAVSDANAYLVECAEDANFEYVVDSSGWIGETSYVFFGLETDVTYWYRVKAGYYCDIESWWSNVESSTQVSIADAVLALLNASDVKNENMLLSLANKLDAVQGMTDKGQYKAAISKLENDILQKTDGCAESGAPDKNDWITTCERQELVYPIIIEIIELLSDE